jgi:3-hydroxy-9,10-secoandrosta-1,3,5(10)-triene-9,17-dione monooxygenase
MDAPALATPTAADLVQRSRELALVLGERALSAGKLRRMPDETMSDFQRLGFWKAVQPKRYGGYELNPRVIYDMQLELGRGCGSSSWVFGVIAVHSWQLALFPEQAQDEVWGKNPDALISSSYMPVGKVEKVDGGVRLSGRWSFSSGCDHCDWVFLGSFMPQEAGAPPDMRTFLLPRSDYEIIDNWHVSGLRASGSKDIVVREAFVPEHRMHKFSDGFKASSPGNAVNPSPVYRYPFGQIHVHAVSTPAIGVALGALDEYVGYIRAKISQATGGKAADSFTNQAAAADAAALLDREVLALRRDFDEMWSHIERGQPIPVDRRVRFRYDAANAVNVSVSVVDRLFGASGGRVLFEDNTLNRHFQDVHAIGQHHANGMEKPSENFGAVQLGKKSTDFFI